MTAAPIATAPVTAPQIERPAAHLARQRVVTGPGGVGGEERAGEERARQHGEDAADPRRRSRPRRPHVAVPSLGTRPLAIAPAIIPRKNGVISDDAANTMPCSWASPQRGRELAEREGAAAQHDAERRRAATG